MEEMVIVKCTRNPCQRVVVGLAAVLLPLTLCPFCGGSVESVPVELRHLEEE